MSQLDEVEYSRLAAQVQEIEKLVNSGQPGDVGYLLKSFLHNAKSRMEEIRNDEVRVDDQKKVHKTNEISTAVQLAEMERNLSADEKQQYSGFLKLDYFTKSNFSELDQFYSNSWDKLSEEGKSQMSYRVWEGIRHNEYSFDELPENIRKKEAERLYGQLTGVDASAPALANIPEQDRADFIREYEAGNEKATAEVLTRKSFSLNVSTNSTSEGSLRDSSLSSKKEGVDQRPQKIEIGEANDPTESLSMAGVTFADATQISPPSVQEAGGPVTVRS